MKKVLVIILLLMICGCCDRPSCTTPLFHEGEMVRSAVGNHTGQVIEVRGCGVKWKNNYYNVRWNIKSSTTNTHLLDYDDDIETGLSLITFMREFELKQFNNKN
jgi:hypothetical protein